MVTYVGLVHRVTVGDTGEPVFRLVLRVDDSTINELQECGFGVAVILAEILEELVGFSQVEDVERAPSLTGADVEPPLTLSEQRQELTEVELGWNFHSNSVATVHCGMVDSTLS